MENWRKYLSEEDTKDTGMPPSYTRIPRTLNKVEQFINSPTVKMKLIDNLTKVMNVSDFPHHARDEASPEFKYGEKIPQYKTDFKLKNIKNLVNKKLFNQKLNLSDIAGDIPGIPQEMKDLNIKAELKFKDIRKPSTGVLKVDIPIGDGTVFTANLPTKLKKLDKGDIQFTVPTKYGSLAMTSGTNFKRFDVGLSGEF